MGEPGVLTTMLLSSPLKIYYDRESDFWEVLFSDAAGFMRETNHNDVMERVGENGEILGFTIMQVSHHDKEKPLVAELA